MTHAPTGAGGGLDSPELSEVASPLRLPPTGLNGELLSRAAINWEAGGGWSVEEITIDPPRRGEVLLRIESAGLCHTDEPLAAGGHRLFADGRGVRVG